MTSDNRSGRASVFDGIRAAFLIDLSECAHSAGPNVRRSNRPMPFTPRCGRAAANFYVFGSLINELKSS